MRNAQKPATDLRKHRYAACVTVHDRYAKYKIVTHMRNGLRNTKPGSDQPR